MVLVKTTPSHQTEGVCFCALPQLLFSDKEEVQGRIAAV